MTNRNHATTFPGAGDRRLLRRSSLFAGILIAGAVAAGVGAVYLFNRTAADQASAAPAPAAQVRISRSGVEPATVTVKTGQTVGWVNNDVQGHVLGLVDTGVKATSTAPGFGGDTAMNPQESYSYTFNAPGTYTYTDARDPGHFRGFVIVK